MTEIAGERVLLHELNHRINNEFSAAISAVSFAARRSNNDEVKAELGKIVELLHQYADVHRALQMPECDTLVDVSTYLPGSAVRLPDPSLKRGKSVLS